MIYFVTGLILVMLQMITYLFMSSLCSKVKKYPPVLACYLYLQGFKRPNRSENIRILSIFFCFLPKYYARRADELNYCLRVDCLYLKVYSLNSVCSFKISWNTGQSKIVLWYIACHVIWLGTLTSFKKFFPISVGWNKIKFIIIWYVYHVMCTIELRLDSILSMSNIFSQQGSAGKSVLVRSLEMYY